MSDFIQGLRPTQIRLVAEIAEHGQLQLAAAACNLTQPAASRLLAETEARLGERLFLRNPKGMEPTPAGSLIAHHARRLLTDLGRMSEEFAQFRAGLGGSVRVGAVTGPALGHLVPAIRALKAEAPGVEVMAEVAPSVALISMLERGELDFALARLPPRHDDAAFEVEPARDEIVRLLVRAGHPMLDRGPVPIGLLHDLPWVLQERGMPIRAAIETAFHDEGLPSPGNVTTTSALLVIVALLKDTDAVAPMSQEVVDLMLDPPVSAGFRKLELNRLITVAPYLILRTRGRQMSRAAERLFGLVRQSVRSF